MYLLELLDDIYAKEKSHFNIPSEARDYYSFIPIQISDSTQIIDYLIMKGDRAKLLILSGMQKVYLTDLQIIDIILKMPDADIGWFIAQFTGLYRGIGAPVRFTVGSATFDWGGLYPFPNQNYLVLPSDTIIDYNELCFLLNFIFYKDFCNEKMRKKDGFSKQTLCKFIVMIDYYWKRSKRSEDFLKLAGYRFPKDYRQEETHVKTVFEDLNTIKKLDISAYM